MHGDTFAFGIGRIAGVLSRVRRPGALDEQKGRGRVALFRDDRHSAAGRIVADNLRGGGERERERMLVINETFMENPRLL